MIGSIIDYPRDTLDPQIWESDPSVHGGYTLVEDIKQQITDAFVTFLDAVGLPEDSIVAVYLYGSIMSNQYNDETDVDGRILLDPQIVYDVYGDEILGDDLFDMAEGIIHDVILEGTKHPLNMTVVIAGEETELGQAELGVDEENPLYEVTNDEFLVEPYFIDQEFDPDVDLKEKIDVGEEKADEINELLFDLEKDIDDFEYLLDAVKNISDKKKFNTKIENKKDEIESALNDLRIEQSNLKKKRYGKEKVHTDLGNIVYKIVEKYKLLGKLKAIKKVVENGFDEKDIESLKRILGHEQNSTG